MSETSLTPWGPTGYVTYKRTYARKLNEEESSGVTEEFPQTISRVLNACQTQLGCNFSEDELKELRMLLLSLKGSVAGRFLWQLGTHTVDKLGLMSLQNCALTVINDPVDPFIWAFDALMLGAGVGYNLQKEHVHEIPRVKYKVTLVRKDTKDADFIVPDTREGWIELLRKVLKYHFVSGFSFSYSTICIRGKGSPIKGFGGTASGPEELCEGIEQINEILNNRVGKKLRPIDVLDIMNIIGAIVVAGNVRRSAQIAIGDADDLQFLNAKRWDKGKVPNWRAMSNNSVVCNDINYLPEQFWNGYDGKGEPYGLINLKLARQCGRLGETQYPDPDVQGFNPCGEQSLNNYETCCLSEVFLPNISSYEELCKLLRYLYIINKHSLRLKCHQEKTNDIVHKNMRMGIGVTGYLQATELQKSWLSDAYSFLRKLDAEYSALKGWPQSIKLTTCKPSGTMALLPGVTPGVHPGFSHYFIRRIRMASNQPIVDICRSNGYPVEYQKNFDGSTDRNTVVVSFPSSYPETTVVAKDLTAVQQLEYVRRLQTEWSDNAVSCTVYYKKEELPAIKAWLLEHYNTSIKSVSFLLHSDHGFAQAPYEEISKEQFIALSKKVKPLSSISFTTEELDDSACETGHCPIR
jgi:ribonucleoside-triphosphate reductase (thioredoxin)